MKGQRLKWEKFAYKSAYVEGKNAAHSTQCLYLNLFKGDLKGKRFIVVRVEGALLDSGFLFLEAFIPLIHCYFHIRIYTKGN